jgi:hypothetical protein
MFEGGRGTYGVKIREKGKGERKRGKVRDKCTGERWREKAREEGKRTGKGKEQYKGRGN